MSRGEDKSVTVLDARTVTDPSNADEVLAFWLYYAEPDDVVTLHGPFCRTQLDVRHECTCTPVTLRLGAAA